MMNFLELFEREALISAHRGASAFYPENTLSALQASIGHCDFIEVDVQLSRDKIAIIMHDETLQRTTNVSELAVFQSRAPFKVCDFTYKELLSLDYGILFNKYEPLLTLKDTLQFAKENNLFINLEIKDIHEDFSDEDVVCVIAKEIELLAVQKLILISSFRHRYLPLCKTKLPTVATAALIEDKTSLADTDPLIQHLKNLKVEGCHFDEKFTNKQTVANLHKEGFFVNVYTVNDPLRQKELFCIGINGIFSDFCA